MQLNKSNTFIKKYPITSYFSLTFLVTIGLGASYQFFNNPFISPQYAPAIAVIITLLITKNWGLWQIMILSKFKKPVKLFWGLISIFLPAAIILSATVIMSLLNINFVAFNYNRFELVTIISITVLGCIFEEIGWRGYLLPKLLEKQNLLNSSIKIGILWGVWHLKFAYGILAFMLFILLMICFSILMSWIYINTKGNLYYMILFHFGVNVTSLMLLTNREGLVFYCIATLICLLICMPLVIKNKEVFLKYHKPFY